MDASLLADMRAALLLLETEMRRLNWWQRQAPAEEALRSREPFCIDTLTFNQWLQWVYTPKMHAFMNQHGRLPPQSLLLPIAEEAWRGCEEEAARLLTLVRALDAISRGEPGALAAFTRHPH